MVRYYLLTLKIISLAIFIWLYYIFLAQIFHFNEVITTDTDEYVLLSFIEAIRNVFSYLIYGFGYIIALLFIIATVGYVGRVYGNTYMYDFIRVFFERYISKWFAISTPQLSNLPNLITDELQILLNDFYSLSFQILFIASIYYSIRAIFKSDPKTNFLAIGSVIMMIIIPLMIFGFRDMLHLLNISIPYLENLPNPIDEVLDEIPIENFFEFIASPVILFAIISYIYLELAFQIDYTDIVTKPSLERSERLEAQLSILARESYYVNANVEKIKEEAKKKLAEIEKGEEERLAIGKLFAKTGKRFSYVKEMIERKKLEEEEKKLITAASKTRRLGRYVDRLFREDPESRDTLTASSSAPRVGNLALSTIINFTYRIILLLIISFIIIHPKWILGTVIQLPPAITESVAMYSPEAIIILLLPIMLIFPVISQLISFIKHRNLIIRLKQEGRIKEILTSVGDYVIKEEAKELGEEKIEELAAEST